MRARQVALLFLGIFLAALLASCQKPFHEETERYVFVAANINLPYWREAQAGFEDSGRGLGVKVEFTGPTSYSPEEQLAAFRRAVASGATGIVVAPTRPELFNKEIDAAVQAGVPVICADSDAPDSRRILFIGTDNAHAGGQSGRRMAELIKGKGQIVLITIPGQLNLEERRGGAEAVFQNYPDIKVTKTIDDKGDPRIANDEISAILEKKEKIDGILCLEASGGPGAAEALHRLNMDGKIPIVAMDKNPETLDWISRGSIAATVAQKSYGLRFLDDLHHNVVHEFKDWRTAPVSPLPAFVDTGTAVIDQKNLAEFRAAAAERREPL